MFFLNILNWSCQQQLGFYKDNKTQNVYTKQ